MLILLFFCVEQAVSNCMKSVKKNERNFHHFYYANCAVCISIFSCSSHSSLLVSRFHVSVSVALCRKAHRSSFLSIFFSLPFSFLPFCTWNRNFGSLAIDSWGQFLEKVTLFTLLPIFFKRKNTLLPSFHVLAGSSKEVEISLMCQA